MLFKSFTQFNEAHNGDAPKLDDSDSPGQYELTQQAYSLLHERGIEPATGDFEKAWDQLSIFDIVRLLNDKEMISSEGWGGKNKYGNIPSYIEKRIGHDCTQLEGSDHIYGTWDKYCLYVPKADPTSQIAVRKVRLTKTRGSAYSLQLVHYKKIMYVSHESTEVVK